MTVLISREQYFAYFCIIRFEERLPPTLCIFCLICHCYQTLSKGRLLSAPKVNDGTRGSPLWGSIVPDNNGRLSWNYLPCPPRGGAGRIRGFLATFDCQQCESDTRFVSYFKPNSSLKWRNLKIWRSMSYVLSASEWSYTVTIRITVALLNGPMCSWFFSLRWLRLFAINVK